MDEVAWYQKNSGPQTHAVGTKKPNEFGLYDMSGNVNEWCWDKYDAEGSRRVVRGGDWRDYASYCRSAFRIWPWDTEDDIRGFRVVLAPVP